VSDPEGTSWWCFGMVDSFENIIIFLWPKGTFTILSQIHLSLLSTLSMVVYCVGQDF
jgi:hypothetical protein